MSMVKDVKKHLIQFNTLVNLKTAKSVKIFKKGQQILVRILRAYHDEGEECCDMKFSDLKIALKVKYELFSFVEDEGGYAA